MTKDFDELADGYDEAVRIAKSRLPDPKLWTGAPHYLVPVRLDDHIITNPNDKFVPSTATYGEVGGTIEIRFYLTPEKEWVLD